jgi:hypothetical protein
VAFPLVDILFTSLRFIENVLKSGFAATWRQQTLYDNNCFIILYFVSGKVEQSESLVYLDI